MTELKRYRPWWTRHGVEIDEDVTGDWVRYYDIEPLIRDAMRWRALRDGSLYSICGLYVADGGNDWRSVEGDELDQRIDSAMQEQSK